MFRTLPCSRLTLVSFLTFVLQAQEPVRIPFGCSEAELQTAGLLCTEEEPCPIYLEINAIAPAGKGYFWAEIFMLLHPRSLRFCSAATTAALPGKSLPRESPARP